MTAFVVFCPGQSARRLSQTAGEHERASEASVGLGPAGQQNGPRAVGFPPCTSLPPWLSRSPPGTKPSTIAPSSETTYFPHRLGHFASGMIRTANFGFLAAHDSNLVTLGGQAERYFRDDPPTCLIKLRQLAELLTKLVAAHHAVYRGERETFEDPS